MTISDPPIFSHTPALSGYRIAISAHRRRYVSTIGVVSIGYSQGYSQGYPRGTHRVLTENSDC